MDDFVEKLLSVFIIIMALGLLSMPYVIYKSVQHKRDFYTECITTDFDKFQCYAMIYGDA